MSLNALLTYGTIAVAFITMVLIMHPAVLEGL